MTLPTHADNLPNTIAESLAAGTPCVASSVGGCPEMVDDGETGFLAHPGDPSSLAQAICRVLDLDPSSAEIMSAACRRRALDMFDPAKIARAYMDVYGSVGR